VAEEPLFKTGVLARNIIAASFTIPAKPIVWPVRSRMLGPNDKKATLEAYRGKLLLVDLWAEWCTPCIRELPGVAYHRARSATETFEIIPICTGTQSFTRSSQTKAPLEQRGIKDLNSWLDISEDYRLIDLVCTDPKTGRGAVPCMLIIDADGQVRGHALGGFDVTVEAGPDAGRQNNAWNTTVSTEFITALKFSGLPRA
jgi:thiol-disulfide isomerase/thioredoxin